MLARAIKIAVRRSSQALRTGVGARHNPRLNARFVRTSLMSTRAHAFDRPSHPRLWFGNRSPRQRDRNVRTYSKVHTTSKEDNADSRAHLSVESVI